MPIVTNHIEDVPVHRPAARSKAPADELAASTGQVRVMGDTSVEAASTTTRERQHSMIGRMVLLGASGNLTSRLLMPAVAQLAEAELLPRGFTIVGSANTDWSTEDFRQHIAAELKKHAPVAQAARDAVVRMLRFQPADVTRPEEVSRLIGDGPETLVYLALPPGLFPLVLRHWRQPSCAPRTRSRSRNRSEPTWLRRSA